MRGKRFVYGSYRGRRSTTDVLKTVALILAVLVVLAVAGVWMAQKYISTTTGVITWSCPSFKGGTGPGAGGLPGGGRACRLPAGGDTGGGRAPSGGGDCPPFSGGGRLGGGAGAQAGANSVLLDMKTDRGQLASSPSWPMAASAGSTPDRRTINRQSRPSTAGELYTAPACPASGTTALAKDETYAIRTNSGYRWTDPEELRDCEGILLPAPTASTPRTPPVLQRGL